MFELKPKKYKTKKGERVVAKVLDEKKKPTDKRLILDTGTTESPEIKITGKETLFPLPDKKVIEKIYISAPSGAGKSTWCGMWLKEYKKLFPKNPIYLFSAISEDSALDPYEPIRIQLNEELVRDPIAPEELANSVVIFDDVETTQDKFIRDGILKLRDILLECGRHYKIRLLITSHIMSDYKKTRLVLTEATTVVAFPQASSTHHLKRYLKNYAGFSKDQIKKFVKLKSRWVALNTQYPPFVIYDKGAYLANGDDED